MVVATIIGGTGRMGVWFADFFAANGCRVMICDKNESQARKLAKRRKFKFIKRHAKAAELSDIIILATPTYSTNSVLKKIVPHISKTTLLVEISSFKEPIRKTIQGLTKSGVPVLSIHPMFGPSARNLADKAVIVVQEPRENPIARSFLSMLRKSGANIVRSNFREHDRIVAMTLALPHLMNFAFLETLRNTSLSLSEARVIGGTTFRLQLLLAEALYHENLHNETSILADGKYSRKLYAAFAQRVDQLRHAARSDNQRELMTYLRKEHAYVRKDPMFLSAYERFAAAVEAAGRY
jgi:prephenate dehydrogenase